jgi:hypothetical protein
MMKLTREIFSHGMRIEVSSVVEQDDGGPQSFDARPPPLMNATTISLQSFPMKRSAILSMISLPSREERRRR